MKTLIAFLTFLIGLTILRCSASVIHVWISRTNGEDIITMNTPLSREELKTRFTTLAEIQPTAAIWIGVQPLVSANTVIDVIDILRQAGINISYLYSFLLGDKGILVFRTDNPDLTRETILLNRLHYIDEEQLDGLISK